MRRRALLAAMGPITFYVKDYDGLATQYTIPYQMTWEKFINSDLNETEVDVTGRPYKPFVLEDDIPHYRALYDGEWDAYYPIYEIKGLGYVKKNQYIESKYYYGD